MSSKVLRTTFVLVVGVLAAAAPAWCQYRTRSAYEQEGEFRLRLGAFQPDGNSQYWRDRERDFTGSTSDLQGASGGIDYLLSFNNQFGLLFSGSYYEGTSTNAYRDFEDNFGGRIRHDTTLGIGSATVGVLVHLTGPGAPVRPYIGGGGGAYFWRLEESGDFVDFSNHNQIFSDTLKSDGTAFGTYFLVGLEAPISRRVSLFAEGRWTQVKKDLNGDLEGFGKLDLSGREFAAGLAWSL